eukprot:TRINITY_DN2647_c0_g1_i1.p1 TRINITY_DN2647_c0_g1~~TRINITY_DN2647_c0_g1_i1.p1  ORF type:complete len:165 (-),score=50.46 TRINITY_DN2647_c0_g1_i1:158-610(-)
MGQLGIGDNTSKNTPVEVSALPAKVSHVSCGRHFTVAHLVNGEWYVWGYNGGKQLCDGTTINKNTPQKIPYLNNKHPILISCGYDQSLTLLDTGEVWVWGCNSHGALGVGDTNEKSTPLQLQLSAARGEGRIHRVVFVTCGEFHSSAIIS